MISSPTRATTVWPPPEASLDDLFGGPRTPDGRLPAPGRLRLVESFLNTRGILRGTDRLSDPPSTTDWLARLRLLPAAEPISLDDLARVLVVREALRELVAARGWELTPGDRRALDEAADRAALEAVGAPGRLVPRAAGVDGALGHILAAVEEARASGAWPRLKLCHDESCRFAFYDHSPTAHGAWCVPSCGQRHRRQRRREGLLGLRGRRATGAVDERVL